MESVISILYHRTHWSRWKYEECCYVTSNWTKHTYLHPHWWLPATSFWRWAAVQQCNDDEILTENGVQFSLIDNEKRQHQQSRSYYRWYQNLWYFGNLLLISINMTKIMRWVAAVLTSVPSKNPKISCFVYLRYKNSLIRTASARYRTR